MLTVKEAAVKFGVSKVAVYRRINNLIKDDLKPFIVQKDGVTHILPQGVELIGESLGVKDSGTSAVKDEKDTDAAKADMAAELDRLNALQREYIETLKKELDRKERQLAKKDELLERNNDLLQNFQVIVRQSQERIKALEGEAEEEREGWWRRLKWWG